MRRRSNGVWSWGAAAWLLAGAAALAQSTLPQTAPQSPQTGQQAPVDSDPVPSPDASVPTTPGYNANTPSGVIESQGSRFTLRENAYEVRLNASVIDGSGKPIDSLPQDAFHVYEDGVLQTIISFKHEDVPVSLGLLIDSSGSMYDKRPAVDKASLSLIQLSNHEDEEFLVDFSSEAYIDTDFTNSVDKLKAGLSYIKSSGGTALYDAVLASADYLAKNGKRTKQVLVIITDGEDNASSASLEQTIRRVQELDGPAIYAIGLLFGDDIDRREARHAKEVLAELAEQTGGQAYFPKSLKDVDGIAAEVAQDIRTQYSIGYRSTNPPNNGGYRKVHVEAKEKGFHGLQVRTRAGYFPHAPAAGETPTP